MRRKLRGVHQAQRLQQKIYRCYPTKKEESRALLANLNAILTGLFVFKLHYIFFKLYYIYLFLKV